MNKPAKTPELPTFETVEQLMADSYLRSMIQEKLDYINGERNRVSEGGKHKLRASPVEFLIKMDKFTAEFIATEYLEIHNKRSKLSFAIREFVTYTIQECVGETFKHYETQFQKQNKKPSKSKKHETTN